MVEREKNPVQTKTQDQLDVSAAFSGKDVFFVASLNLPSGNSKRAQNVIDETALLRDPKNNRDERFRILAHQEAKRSPRTEKEREYL